MSSNLSRKSNVKSHYGHYRRTAMLSVTQFPWIVLGALVLCSCSVSKNLSTAKEAVETFHKQFRLGQDDAIYEAADSVYKASISREASHELFSGIRQKMGEFKSTEYVNFLMNETTAGTFVRVQYKTQFANGTADEEFTFRVDRNHAILVRYEVRSG